MFDIGFSELILVSVVGLLVLGPTRLPVAIRTVMSWVRTIRGLAANVQNELAQELKLQELQESIKKAENLNLQALSPELAQTVEELKASAQKMKADLDKQAAETQTTVQQQIDELRALNAEKSTEEGAEKNADLAAQKSLSDDLSSTKKLSENSPAVLTETVSAQNCTEIVQGETSSDSNKIDTIETENAEMDKESEIQRMLANYATEEIPVAETKS